MWKGNPLILSLFCNAFIFICRYWCSTKLDTELEHVPGSGNWGFCRQSCPPIGLFTDLELEELSELRNCSVLDVTEILEVCTPTIKTACEDVNLPIKIIEDIPFTYTVTRTTCTESIEVVPNEVCTFSYEQETEDTTSKTGEVTFERVVAKENTYNVPAVTPVDVPVTVAYERSFKICCRPMCCWIGWTRLLKGWTYPPQTSLRRDFLQFYNCSK